MPTSMPPTAGFSTRATAAVASCCFKVAEMVFYYRSTKGLSLGKAWGWRNFMGSVVFFLNDYGCTIKITFSRYFNLSDKKILNIHRKKSTNP